MTTEVTFEILKGFLEAFNRHDLEFRDGKITRKDSFWKILD